MSAPAAPGRVLLLGQGALQVARECRQHPNAAPGTTWEAHEDLTACQASRNWTDWRRAPGSARGLLLAADARDAQASATEDAFRLALSGAGLPHQVIYPQAGRHTPAVLQALGWAPAPSPMRRLRRSCADCLDAACEHRLFQDLLAQRAERVTAGDRTPEAAAAG